MTERGGNPRRRAKSPVERSDAALETLAAKPSAAPEWTASREEAAEAAASDGNAGARVDATNVTLVQGGAREIRADRVEIKQGGAGRVEAAEVVVRQGGIGVARGKRIDIQMGGAGGVVGDRVELHQAFTRFVLARESTRLDQGAALTVVANTVEVGPQSGVGIVIAREVTGDVRALFDWRAGLAFGAAVGLIVTLSRRLRDR